jgi:two-component system, OmpR family, response regulator
MSEKQTPKTVLIVDDDHDFLIQMRLQLQNAGYEVLTAEGQKEAEELLADTHPDIAVIDLMMEFQDGGFVLCHHIKKKYPDVPVIMVSAVYSETGIEFDSTTDEERSWIKADRVLAKPVRFEQIMGEIEHLTKGR